jgi:hypothetical protein
MVKEYKNSPMVILTRAVMIVGNHPVTDNTTGMMDLFLKVNFNVA